jgi:transposase InsO family protein
MRDAFGLIWLVLIGLFRSRASLQVEILTLRHQLNVLRRKSPQRLAFTSIDRLVFAGLYRLAPGVLDALVIVRPETVIRWHRAGFRAYWRWKSRPRGGRPKTPLEIRHLIHEMSLANPLWGAPRIHGELLKLGIDVGQTTVAKYMARGRRPPSQGWKTFLHNHADGIASMDLFVVPTLSFRLLYGLLILHHDRRQILWLGVTAHPTAEWISRQLTEAYGWNVQPRYIVVRDRDAVYGDVFIRRLRAMGIRDRPTAARSPWQNGYCERAIGSIRRECLDHVVFGERHLRHLLRSYTTYYNAARTHLSVNKDALLPRTVHSVGRILPTPFLGGLHHLYVRV